MSTVAQEILYQTMSSLKASSSCASCHPPYHGTQPGRHFSSQLPEPAGYQHLARMSCADIRTQRACHAFVLPPPSRASHGLHDAAGLDWSAKGSRVDATMCHACLHAIVMFQVPKERGKPAKVYSLSLTNPENLKWRHFS